MRHAVETGANEIERLEHYSASLFLSSLVGSAFGVSPGRMQAAGRGPAAIAFARQVAMYLAHTRLRLPLIDAGALFGRDRTTAAHACRKVEDRREEARVDLLLDLLERAIDQAPCKRGHP